MPQRQVSMQRDEPHHNEVGAGPHVREPGGGVPGRRTIAIQGRGSERYVTPASRGRRRPSRRSYEQPGFRPDRVAMWAVLLGVLLVFVAATSSHAAQLRAGHAAREASSVRVALVLRVVSSPEHR